MNDADCFHCELPGGKPRPSVSDEDGGVAKPAGSRVGGTGWGAERPGGGVNLGDF